MIAAASCMQHMQGVSHHALALHPAHQAAAATTPAAASSRLQQASQPTLLSPVPEPQPLPVPPLLALLTPLSGPLTPGPPTGLELRPGMASCGMGGVSRALA